MNAVYPLPSWLTAMGYTDPAMTVKFCDPKTGEPFWESNPGPQTWTLLCPYDEITIGGSRGGGKSCLIAPWMAMGDLSLPEGDPARYSYLNDPAFKGLILREQYQDLKEFVENAMDFFRHFGCKPKDDPVVFEFKSGAKIYTNHLNNEEAYNKYRGWGITKIAIEELVQIPKRSQYLKLFGSMRSVDRVRGKKKLPKLRTQSLNTTNPDGPGAIWVKERFIEVRTSKGDIAPWNMPLLDRNTSLKRIFIPMRLKDNPYLSSDNRYLGMLKSQDAVTQRQWIDGDWDAGSGLFFRDYRPSGPLGVNLPDGHPDKEPAWARHLVDPVELKPWWFRWGSGDWGYDHPASFHKYCRNERDGRIHVYDELHVRQISSYELGVMLAKWWMRDLENLPDHQITIYLSPDAFGKRDETKTLAEQMAMGMQEANVAAFLWRFNDEERLVKDPKVASAMFERRRAESLGKMCINLKPGNRNRKAGWGYIRDLLNFRPALSGEKPDMEYAKTLATRDLAAYENYLSTFRDMKPEVLPKVHVWKICKELDRCLRTMVTDPDDNGEMLKVNAENGQGGDDDVESFKYGCAAYKELESTIPKVHFISNKMAEVERMEIAPGQPMYQDPAVLAQIEAFQSAKYDQQHASTGGGYTFARRGAMLHRRPN